MNQHFNNNSEENSDEFEKRLSAISLVTPSEKYKQIPDRLQTEVTTQDWGHWRWLAAGALACSAVILVLTDIDLTNLDSTMETQPENFVAESSGSLLQDNQPELTGSLSAEQRFVAGNHYIELRNPIDMSDSTTTEVVAFFWYPCWPCSEFEEYLTSWESELSDDVTLTRIPAIWSSTMRFHARAYFTAQVLGVLDQSHRQFYIEFEKDSPKVANEEELQQFFSTIGISAAEFLRAYHSETILELLDYAEEENRVYQIQSTPSIFVAGKYGISPQGAGGFQEMLEVTDFLIEGI